MLRCILVLGLLTVPATAQTTYYRDNSGNQHGYSVQQGNHTYFHDNSGNLKGDSVQQR